MVVAVKLDIIKGSGDAMPAGHGCGFRAADMGHGGHDDIAETQRFADQDNFEFDRSADWQLSGAEKINAGGTDVASNEGYGRFFWDSAGTAKAQREVQSRAGVFAMFRMDAHGMRGHPGETPRLSWTQERRDAKGRDARWIDERLWSKDRLARFRGWFGWPQFRWSCALRRAHITLRDATSLSLATAQQNELPN